MPPKKQIYCTGSLVKGNKPLIRQNTLQIYYFPLTKLVIEEKSMDTTIIEENELKVDGRHTDRQDKNNMSLIFHTGAIKSKIM